MITTPPTRPTDDTLLPADALDDPAALGPPPPTVVPATGRVVTPAQVDRAVLQLRERRGQTPVEQVQAVLRALDLTVAQPTPDGRA